LRIFIKKHLTMAFRTRIDYSENRQILQRERTDSVLSGKTTFGMPFSALTSGPDPDLSAVTSTVINIISTFSGNTGTTVFSFGDPRMDVGANGLTVITPSNSGTTQSTGNQFESSLTTVIDGNVVNLEYTGASFNFNITGMTEVSPGAYTGSAISLDVDFLSAGTLDFTGRTIWVENVGITQTKDLIITDGAVDGYVWTAIGADGEGGWKLNSSGGTSATTTFWSAGTGTNAIAGKGHDSIASGNNTVVFGDGVSATTNFASAQNRFTLASGTASHAEGNRTTASNTASHAEGNRTTASGLASHAEGTFTTASGDYSHAEGTGTTASGDYSHSEGWGNVASGQSSHAEGRETIAGGQYSHAEGRLTTASGGEGSHAEGVNTTASGTSAHAEGNASVAGGSQSHAEGLSSTALGDSSHAEGRSTKALNEASHAEGFGTTADGTNTIGFGFGPPSAHAEGYRTSALGDASHSGGKGADLSGPKVIASGQTAFNHSEVDGTYVGSGASADRSFILGGLNHTVDVTATNSGILGGVGLTATSANTIYMVRTYIDEYVDLNPQTTLPSPKTGRIFFSGGSTNRLVYNSGGTASDWVIIT
jgi:hypothetical protein